MAIQSFHGGTALYDGKEITRDLPVKTVLPRGEMVYPLKQLRGEPASPKVEVGDHVLTGQMIAEAVGQDSAAVHASVSGDVVSIEDRTLAGGEKTRCIVISNDGRYDEIVYPESRHISGLTPQTIIKAVRSAGVVESDSFTLRDGVSTADKLETEHPERIDFIIANCMESAPYMTSDYRRILENPMKVIYGLRILMKMFPKARGILAVDERDREIIRTFRSVLKGETGIYIRRLSGRYPQGEEHLLVHTITDRTVEEGKTAADAGCMVFGVDTLVAINQAVIVHEPMITKLITLSGDAFLKPQNYRVRIGMSIKELIERCGGFAVEPELLVNGDTMTGIPVDDRNVPVTKLTTGLIALRKDRFAKIGESACIRCGSCIRVCPESLNPFLLYKDSFKDTPARFKRHHGMRCISCGLCSFVCPAGVPVADAVDKMKELVLLRTETEKEAEIL